MKQLETVRKMHDADLKAGYSGDFLDDLLEKKYPHFGYDYAGRLPASGSYSGLR
ncbi:MAG: hypothetical protein AB1552_06180 [Nitrospirota bacterium]